jgi:polyhydroxyalkanoate synthesis regulator phasin
MMIERGMKLMSDPRIMKLMSNPKVMKVAMQAFQLRGKAQAQIDQRMKSLVKSLKLATHDEVRELQATIRSLEQLLKETQPARSNAKGK